MVMMLRQCCCGCSLKTGTIILGVLNLIGGLVYLLTGIAAAAVADDVESESKNVVIAVGAVLAVLGAIMLVVAICLIIGATNGKPALLVPWMVYTVIFLVANIVLSIVFAAQCFALKDGASGVGYIVGGAIYTLLGTYYLLVVYSLYRELNGTAPPNNA